MTILPTDSAEEADKLSNEDKDELESLLTLKFQFFENHKT